MYVEALFNTVLYHHNFTAAIWSKLTLCLMATINLEEVLFHAYTTFPALCYFFTEKSQRGNLDEYGEWGTIVMLSWSKFPGEKISVRQYIVIMEQPVLLLPKFGTKSSYTQKNGEVSNVNNKFISHLTWAQNILWATGAVQVSHVLITVLQYVHLGSHNTLPHGNQTHPRLGVACPL
jgi:hypothetical protein